MCHHYLFQLILVFRQTNIYPSNCSLKTMNQRSRDLTGDLLCAKRMFCHLFHGSGFLTFYFPFLQVFFSPICLIKFLPPSYSPWKRANCAGKSFFKTHTHTIGKKAGAQKHFQENLKLKSNQSKTVSGAEKKNKHINKTDIKCQEKKRLYGEEMLPVIHGYFSLFKAYVIEKIIERHHVLETNKPDLI